VLGNPRHRFGSNSTISDGHFKLPLGIGKALPSKRPLLCQTFNLKTFYPRYIPKDKIIGRGILMDWPMNSAVTNALD